MSISKSPSIVNVDPIILKTFWSIYSRWERTENLILGRTDSSAATSVMSFQMGIDSLGGTFFQLERYNPLRSIWFSYWYTGINVPILAPKIGKYTFLYTDIFFFRYFPQFKIKRNLFSSKKIYLSYFKPF